MRKALLVEYTRTPAISKNGQAVTIAVTDFVVDVVPAFACPWWTRYEDWHLDRHEPQAPCSAFGLRESSAWWSPGAANQAAQSMEPNRGSAVAVFSPEGPCLVRIRYILVVARNVKSDWASARYFFDNARDKLKYKFPDPSGSGADVGAYLTGSTIEKAISKMTSASERCVRAEKAEKEGDLASMHNAYRRVFGDYYPA